MNKKKVTGMVISLVAVAIIAGVAVFALRHNAPEAEPTSWNGNDTSETTTPEDPVSQTPTPTEPSEGDGNSNNPSSEHAHEGGAQSVKAEVDIKSMAFAPGKVTMKRGSVVIWTNNDSVSHTVTADNGDGPKSKTLAPGQIYTFVFDKAGTFSYHCSLHTQMKGTVTVTK